MFFNEITWPTQLSQINKATTPATPATPKAFLPAPFTREVGTTGLTEDVTVEVARVVALEVLVTLVVRRGTMQEAQVIVVAVVTVTGIG